MMNRHIEVVRWLSENGFSSLKYVKPYSMFANGQLKIGICVTCGLAVIGKVTARDTEMKRVRWPDRSIESLEKIINEGISDK